MDFIRVLYSNQHLNPTPVSSQLLETDRKSSREWNMIELEERNDWNKVVDQSRIDKGKVKNVNSNKPNNM